LTSHAATKGRKKVIRLYVFFRLPSAPTTILKKFKAFGNT